MPIPNYDSLMLPVLKLLSDKETRSLADIKLAMADRLALSEEDRNQRMPDGHSTRFGYNLRWTVHRLAKALLIERPSRANYRITNRGLKVVMQDPVRIDEHYLMQYPEYAESRRVIDGQSPRNVLPGGPPTESNGSPQTPRDQMYSAHEELLQDLRSDLLERVQEGSAGFFEVLVIDLLKAMGYGGSWPEAGRVTGKSGDGEIDGLIDQDRLGLDRVYVQAKKWKDPVGPKEVRSFAGGLDAHGAKKGVFITTSSFTRDAKDFVKKIGEKKIILIDGQELAKLMAEYDVGAKIDVTYSIKRIDSDYFEEE